MQEGAPWMREEEEATKVVQKCSPALQISRGVAWRRGGGMFPQPCNAAQGQPEWRRNLLKCSHSLAMQHRGGLSEGGSSRNVPSTGVAYKWRRKLLKWSSNARGSTWRGKVKGHYTLQYSWERGCRSFKERVYLWFCMNVQRSCIYYINT